MHSIALPIREPPWPDESLTGFVRRHVVAMGYESFARLLGIAEETRFPRHLENLRAGYSLAALAKLLRREPDELAAMTVHVAPAYERSVSRRDTRIDSSGLFESFIYKD